MHEGIISKGDIMKQPLLLPFIMNKENCVLVCPGGGGGKCHRKAHTREGQKIVILHLLTFVDFLDIEVFLINIDKEMKGSQAKDALALLNSIQKEVIHE
jgi:hypothetical protein